MRRNPAGALQFNFFSSPPLFPPSPSRSSKRACDNLRDKARPTLTPPFFAVRRESRNNWKKSQKYDAYITTAAIDGHLLYLARTRSEVRPHRDAVHDQTPDHLDDLDDGDHGRDRFHDLRHALERHEEEVHVHHGMHEIVRRGKPHSWSVLGRQGKPTEEHHRCVMVPLE
eukprot:CAMPEP_0176210884 /NCGR_PEP_ID=MMETSP0121_2-20121125/14370_1 /TAXON_ID=160619 /ORGANISM="Kryptoperidinium foliaceum, Strain CCMP 1326" /LENGTH=169 /DNA_ID=CAMNT_0017549923 /DNA_START=322 /DNA_END=830 /DNA_ORIENTATION=-